MTESYARLTGSDNAALEKARSKWGFYSVVISNLAITGIVLFSVWRLSGSDADNALVVGVLSGAFTAVSTMTTAYLGIKAVSNTAQIVAPDRPPGGLAREKIVNSRDSATPGATGSRETAAPGAADPPE